MSDILCLSWNHRAYGVKSLTTSELNKFIKRAASNPTLLQTYYYNSKVLSYLQSSCLDATCQAKWMCTLKWWTTSADYKDCVSTAEATNTTTVVSMAASSSTSTAGASSSSSTAFFAAAGAVGVATVVLIVGRRYRKNHRDAAALAGEATIETPVNFETIA